MKCRRRGICVIINQVDYSAHPDLDSRSGSDKDAENLEKTFKNLSFEVQKQISLSEELFNNELERWSKYDHSDCDAFVFCLLSHGDTEHIHHPEGRTPFNDIFEPFTGEKCPSLLGKPKLFFIQACQGKNFTERISVQDQMDAAVHIENIRKDGVYRFPTHADLLIAYSTVPGFYSFRDKKKGAWFIRSLCKILQNMDLVETRDILSLLTLVNKDVALDFISDAKRYKEGHERKQIPCIYYTLTRKLYLRPKGAARFLSSSV